MTRAPWPFTIAHTLPGKPEPYVRVFRTYRRKTFTAALRIATEIQRAGYLVWIEQTGQLATR